MKTLYKVIAICVFSMVLNIQIIYAQPSTIGVTLGYSNILGQYPIPGQDIYMFCGSLNGPFTTDVNGLAVSGALSYNNTYTITADMTHSWGGGNATDALIIARHFVSLGTIVTWTDRLDYIADVNLDNACNSTDALLILKRAVQVITSFDAGDWYVDDMNAHVLQADANCDGCVNDVYLAATCYGDVNYSYGPYAFNKSKPTVHLNKSGVMNVKSGLDFNVPIIVLDEIKVGAISMEIAIPPDKYTFNGIIIPESSEDGFWSYYDGVNLHLAWYNVYGIDLNANDNLISLRLTAKDVEWYNGIDGIEINSRAELSDEVGNPYTGVELVMPKLMIANTSSSPEISAFPNPANQNISFNYYIPSNGNVIIKIFDNIGKEVAQPVNEFQSQDSHQINFDLSTLSSGMYSYSFSFNGFNKIEKFVVTR